MIAKRWYDIDLVISPGLGSEAIRTAELAIEPAPAGIEENDPIIRAEMAGG
jgi:hypothetical protein